MEKKANHLVASIICGILTAFGIVASIISMICSNVQTWIVGDMIAVVLSVLIGYYVIWGYRKPNGNGLRYIILLFSIPYINVVYAMAQFGEAWQAVIRTVIVGLLCYIAGRLNKVKQNVLLMSIVSILIVVTIIKQVSNGDVTIGIVTSLAIWINICVAYFRRYKEHKEAGLADAPKK